MNERDDLMALAAEPNEVVRIERLTHHIQRIREARQYDAVGIELEWKVWER